MARGPRTYTHECEECGIVYHPHHRHQKTCSRSCGASRAFRRSEARQKNWAVASLKARRPKMLERLRAELAQCKTLGDAYRLGYAKGYRNGWQTRDRKDNRPMKRVA